MNPILVSLCFIAAASAASLTVPLRSKRDVSELSTEPAYNYLPPDAARLEINQDVESKAVSSEATAAAETVVSTELPTAALGNNGYEYKTVRQLRYRYRQRRDVSHLPLEYLSPVVLPPLPSREYLPPVEEQAAPHLNREYLPPTTTTTTSTTTTTTEAPIVHETVKLSNEYLPPVEESAPLKIENEPELEETTTAVPEAEETTTTTTTTTTEVPTTTEIPTEAPAVKESPEETAVLADDGYHYKQPDVIPDLSLQPEEPLEEPVPEVEELVQEPESEPVLETESLPEPLNREYLPPLVAGKIVAEGPEEESAILADDGYHYRAIRRLKF